MSFITPAPFRSHNNLLLQYHGLARGPYRTTIRRPLEGIHTQASWIFGQRLRVFGAMAGDGVTYGGRRASLQLLERNATPACDGFVVSPEVLACFVHPISISIIPIPISHDHISSHIPLFLFIHRRHCNSDKECCLQQRRKRRQRRSCSQGWRAR
jgi:hypothetical protein